jgi:hypothetical protein
LILEAVFLSQKILGPTLIAQTPIQAINI